MKHAKRPTQADMPQDAPQEVQPMVDTAAQEMPAPGDLPDLQEQLRIAREKTDEYLLMAQRVQADFDNFRRRNASVRSEAFDDGAAAFIRTILPVCDNLDRAISVQTNDESFLDGVRLVQKQLLEALDKRGVHVIDRVGEFFDPKLEDAVMQGTAQEGEPGTVAQVLLKGYKMGDTVLRHAMVKVISG